MSLPSIFIDDAEPEEDNANGGRTTSKQYGHTGVGPSALPFLGYLVRMGLDASTAEAQIGPKKTPAFRGWELVHDRFRDRQESP